MHPKAIHPKRPAIVLIHYYGFLQPKSSGTSENPPNDVQLSRWIISLYGNLNTILCDTFHRLNLVRHPRHSVTEASGSGSTSLQREGLNGLAMRFRGP